MKPVRPVPKPLADMTTAEERDYWRWYARKHEDALKGLLGDLQAGIPTGRAIRRAEARRTETTQQQLG